MKRMKWRHILSAEQFNRNSIDYLFDKAKSIKQNPSLYNKILENKVMAKFFYQPSTRTSFSFDIAMKKLGGHVISTENARVFSSVTKGETLEDTILTLTTGLEVDVIVLRYDEMDGAKRASKITTTPIINAGDGAGEHPTQALLDLFTIQEELGRLDNFKIAMIGDIKNSRTVHSLAKLLTLYKNVDIIFVAPPEISLDKEEGQKTVKYLTKHGARFFYSNDLERVLTEVDVVYVTRIQEEYFTDRKAYDKVFGKYILSPKILPADKVPIIMHPLPRKGEITFAVDSLPQAAYFRQVNNGLYVRMALLSLILGKN